MKPSIRIAVITDLHASLAPVGSRQGQYADIFLLRAVQRLNRHIKPDVVLVLGDLVDDPDDPSIASRYSSFCYTLALLDAPYIVIPGNHDLPASQFYQYLPTPDPFIDIKGFRFIIFPNDPEMPDCNAYRSAEDLERMSEAKRSFSGPMVTVQHVSLAPPDKAIPYNYTNADEIIDCMKMNDIFLSISGHYHRGYELLNYDSLNFVTGAALCEDPFSFCLIETDGLQVTTETQQLRIPQEYLLSDRHVHTEFAYCSDNISMASSLELAKIFGLKDLGFSEHSPQLYCNRLSWGRKEFFTRGLSACAHARHDNINDYFRLARHLDVSKDCLGLEVDIDVHGNLVLDPADRDKLGYIIGAVHYLQESFKNNPDPQNIYKEFLWQTQKFFEHRVDILAHPFRIFSRIGMSLPRELFDLVIDLACKHETAIEVNFNSDNPSIEFIQKCLDANIRLTFGSDSHSCHTIGDFYPHINLLRRAGYSGDFSDILMPLPPHTIES